MVDDISFEEFYLRNQKPLIALAYSVTGSWTTSEDLTQEALTAAYRSWETVRTKDAPGTWVRRILLNKASSTYRRRIAELKALARNPRNSEIASLPEITGEFEHILTEVRRLPRRQIEVIALTYLENMTPTEIAATLGVTKQTVDVHMGRARATLKRRLGLEDGAS